MKKEENRASPKLVNDRASSKANDRRAFSKHKVTNSRERKKIPTKKRSLR